MKTTCISLFVFCLILCGCSTLTERATTGRDFDETKVSQIKKGVTTADGIVAIYGEPDKKEIVSANQVMWHYTYLTTEHKTHNFSSLETTTGYKKNLDILLQDDIVINFAYVKVPIESVKDSNVNIGN